jgi:hypothetical protein
MRALREHLVAGLSRPTVGNARSRRYNGLDIPLGTTGFDVVESQGWLRVEVPGGLVKNPENQYVRTLTSTPSPLSQ